MLADAGANASSDAEAIEDVTETSFSDGVEVTIALVTFLCVVAIIFFTLLFDHGRSELVSATKNTPMQNVVHTLFGELAILGFIALLAFLMTNLPVLRCGKGSGRADCAVMSWLSLKVFSFFDHEEAMEALPEVFEKLHFVVFGIMILFLLIVVGAIAHANHVMKCAVANCR